MSPTIPADAARPHPAAALGRTVTAVTITGLTVLIQHWTRDVRDDAAGRTERHEWISQATYSGTTACGLQIRSYGPGALTGCRDDWRAAMTSVQAHGGAGEVRIEGDPGMLSPAPYGVSLDIPGSDAPVRHGQHRAPGVTLGRLTLDAVADLTFA